VLGASIERVRDIIFQIGLRMPFNDIENFWLVMLINLGILGFVFYLIGFVPLLWHLWKRNTYVPKIMLVCIILVASTSNSLGRKCNILTVAVPAIVATTAFARRRKTVPVALDPRAHVNPLRLSPVLRPRREPGAFAAARGKALPQSRRSDNTGMQPASGA
jgi:hypothetical protein